ncbi:MAG: glycosyltransferase [Clostridia bacterium]|nr:glycosyltransferase [Clostridia bacterium]
MSGYKYKISVITAVYNVKPFLKEAIESVINQDIGFDNIQLILVDDGSTDKSGAICDKYAAKYPDNIAVIHKQNGGPADARNEGLKLAEGEYINFLDGDDKFAPDAFSKVWDFIKDNKENADVFAVPLKYFDGMRRGYPTNNKFKRGNRIIDLKKEWRLIQSNTTNVFIRKSAIGDIRFDTELHLYEDAKFVNQILLKKQTIGAVADTFCYFRKRTSGDAAGLIEPCDREVFYTTSLSGYYKSIIDLCIKETGEVPKFIQMALMFDMQHRISAETIGTKACSLSSAQRKDYLSLLTECLKYIDDDVIMRQGLFDEQKVFTLKIKYGENPEYSSTDNDITATFGSGTKFDFSAFRTVIEEIDYIGGSFVMRGYSVFLAESFKNANIFLSINGEKLACDMENSEPISKCLDNFTGIKLPFSANIPSDNTAKTFSIEFFADIDGHTVALKKLVTQFMDIATADIYYVDAYRTVKKNENENGLIFVCEDAQQGGESAISVKDVKIKYRCLNQISLLKSIMNPKHFSKTEYFEAVKGVSFEVEKGKILGIVGKNGSGKSTLLRAIAGIFSADEGSIDLHGHTISLLSIGVGFQNALTGRENIFLSGLLLGFTKEQINEKLEEIIEFSELEDFIDRPVKTYSSGMYSKLAFSITAILETEIMLIDEVLSVGDARFRKKSFEKMKELIDNKDRTVIIVSHSTDTLSKLCDNILWLHEGEKRMYGTTEQILPEYNAFMS